MTLPSTSSGANRKNGGPKLGKQPITVCHISPRLLLSTVRSRANNSRLSVLLIRIFGEREGRTKCRIERLVPGRGREHRACRSSERPQTHETSRLSARSRQKSAEGFRGR